jgi:DNA (cytosine-5)-methyltransferase 1
MIAAQKARTTGIRDLDKFAIVAGWKLTTRQKLHSLSGCSVTTQTKAASTQSPQSIEAIDLFCGAGGLSHGMARQGVKVVAGFDLDPACEFPYTANHPGAQFVEGDVTKVTGRQLTALWSPGSIRLLAGCAPCQPFSSYANTATVDESKWRLLKEFARLVGECTPDLVTMENVPRLVGTPPFKVFLRALKQGGYHVAYGVLNAAQYGAPQQRKRLVLVASKLGPVALPEPTHKAATEWVTVRQAIGHLPTLEDGGQCSKDPLHRASTLSPLNRKRIRASNPGGTWRDWPKELVAECHRRESGKHSAGVYGRMDWDKPAPTMTTLCNGYGNGRFGHPKQHRGISLREAAIFQSFPSDYRFVNDNQPAATKTLARLIGNAVPPKLGEAVARSLYASITKTD